MQKHIILYMYNVHTQYIVHVRMYTLPSYIEQKPQAGDEIVAGIDPFESDIACTSVHQEHDTLKYTTAHEKPKMMQQIYNVHVHVQAGLIPTLQINNVLYKADN